MKPTFCVLLCFLLLSSEWVKSSPIEHVVVLMMENRSFDHLLGWLHETVPEIDGLTGQECNYLNVNNTSAGRYCVNKHGYDVSPSDPNHDINATTQQIYGWKKPYNTPAIPVMSGFVQNAIQSSLNYTTVMSMFTSDSNSAPIINELAQDFAVFDKWYASLPGPTDPNRGFVMSGTSNGMDTNFNGTLWSQQSYFNFLSHHNVTWNGYYQQDPWALFYYMDIVNVPANHRRMLEFNHFYSNLQQNKLAQFSFLQPQMNTHRTPPDWQHPDASVREGERLIKSVYEALRASPYWEKSALIVTYDEHGGFYDHVTPPQINIPPPDGVVAPDGFRFDRLGIRVPTVVISPWIPKGTVVHRPTGPTPNSEYDHTSVIATCNKLFNITATMTARSSWSGTFEDLFSLQSPRTDCPTTLTHLPSWTHEELKAQWVKPLNDHLQVQIDYYCRYNNRGEDCGKNITNQLEASLFLEEEVAHFLRTLRNKR